ncbi:MAG: FUSC family protein [Acidimicrobiales bacterium]
MAIFQPGHRPRARIVAGAGALVAVGALLGSYFGIHSMIIFPLVAVWTFGVGFAVVLSPQAALIGVSSATSMVFAAGLRVSHGQAVEVGVVVLLCGLLTALVTLVARPLTQRANSSSVRSSPPATVGLTWVRQAWAKIRSAMFTRNFALWHALRLALAAFTGTVLFRVIDAADGFWIPESTLFIMRPDRDLTRRRALLRVIGSVAGAALTTFLLVVLRPDTTMLALLVVLVSSVAFSVQRVNFGLYITFVTTIFVLLVAFGGLPPREAIFLRVVDNLIGSTIAVLAMFLWRDKVMRTTAEPDLAG